jgi:hypothetical protein
MLSSPAERDEYVEYFSESGAITCRVLYRTEQLAFVQFRTVDWPSYKDFINYARVALFHERLSNRKHKANGQGVTAPNHEGNGVKPTAGVAQVPTQPVATPSPVEEAPTRAQKASKGKLNGKEFSARRRPPRTRTIGV